MPSNSNLPRKRRHRRHSTPNPAQRHLDDIKRAFIDNGLSLMDELAERVFSRVFSPASTPPGPFPTPGQGPRPGSTRPPRSRASNGPSTSASTSASVTFYDILEVSRSASPETIAAAWKSLCKRHHPDKGGDAEKIKLINQAHDVLSDPVRRGLYDRVLKDAGI